MESDGKIIISTELDTKPLEKELSNLKKELKQNENKELEIKTNISDIEEMLSALKSALQEEEKQTKSEEALTESRERYNQILEMSNVAIKNYNNELEQIKEKNNQNLEQQKQLLNRIQDINNEISKTKNIKNIETELNKIGKSLKNVTKSVISWGLALFGIRTAYNMIRNAMSTITSEDSQLKADIDYMKNAIAYTLEPVVRKIVELAKQLMQYIGYIVYMWTGKNIFENANKSLKSANVQATKLSKTLAGFDEMNILNDTSGGTSGGGVSTPSFDLAKPENIEPPAWLTWIVEHKPEILSILSGVATALILIKLGLDGIKSLGIGVMIGGIIYTIISLLDYLKDPSWENFGKIIQGIGITLLGLALIIGNIPVAVAGAIVLILGTLIKYWDEIKAFLQKGIDWLKSKSDWIHEKFGTTIGLIYDFIVDTLQAILNWFDLTFTSIKKIFDGIIKFVKGVFTGDWKMAWEGIKEIFGGVWVWIKGTVEIILGLIWDTIKNIVDKIKEKFEKAVQFLKDLFYGLLDVINGITDKISGAVNKIKDGVSNAKNKVGNFFGNIGSNVKDFFGFAKGGIVVPKLASGGIINQPSRGVPISSAIGGERGMEGVIPLTDSQQMMMLGEAIGKYITINANITNTMNGRVISRELQQIQNNDDFAYNR